MTALAVGSSITVAVRDGGTVAIATNGGFGSAVITPTETTASTTVNFGPVGDRRILGPYKEGASIVLTNSTCGSFDYDAETTTDPSNVAITGGSISGLSTFLTKTVTDTRKLAKWFSGTTLVGKKVVWWGDSTTEQMAGLGQINYVGDDTYAKQFDYRLGGTLHYNYGQTGQTLAGALGAGPNLNSGGLDCSIAGVIAAAPDVVVLCWDINAFRANAAIAGASYDATTSTANAAAISGAQTLQARLVTAITQLTAALPNVCIILRMPNGFNAVTGGGAQTYFTNASVSSQNVQDVLRLAYRGDANTSTPIPQLDQVYSNVVLWDAQASVFPETAYPTASAMVTGGNDNLHPSATAYLYTLAGIFSLLAPQSDAGTLLGTAQTQASAIETTTGRGLYAVNVAGGAPLDLSDWRPVYPVQISSVTAGSFADISFGSAAAAVDALGSGTVGAGLVIGDVFVFTVLGVQYAVPVQNAPDSNPSGAVLRWFSSPGFSPSKTGMPTNLRVANIRGIVYRHKYAFSISAKQLIATPYTYNPYKNAYRFKVVSAASGSCVLQSMANEFAANGQQFHSHTLTTSDVMCLAGVEGGVGAQAGSVFGNLGLLMTGASQGAVANQSYTLTMAGVDFRNSIGKQGYLLSST